MRVLGRQLQDVVALTWDDTTVTDELITATFGSLAIALKDPLDAPWRELVRNRGHDQTAAHPNSNRVVRGHSPGQHINAMSLRDRLRRHVFSASATRLGTPHELTKPAHVVIIAEALGCSPKTIGTHATASSADDDRYVAAVLTGDG